MIICPLCETELIDKYEVLCCNNCGFNASRVDDTVFFNPEIEEHHIDFDAEGLDIIFKAEEKHFWFNVRKHIIKDMFDKYIKKDKKVIEIGAGTGNIAKMLLNEGYRVAVGDIHKNGLNYAKSYGIKERYQFDLMKSPFKESFNVVGIFDVLEHLENDSLAVKNIYKILKTGGIVIGTVPAHKWLWTRFDITHKRRYELKEIKKLFTDNGFQILEAKNFFISILPLLYLNSLLNNKKTDMVIKDLIEEFDKKILNINPIINSILLNILLLELKIIKYISSPVGGSIILVAKKIHTTDLMKEDA
jgi:2-polyprenyl-3-methyl-5-hydroxy-6-metoxy-1,4-benzoquinol methylase